MKATQPNRGAWCTTASFFLNSLLSLVRPSIAGGHNSCWYLHITKCREGFDPHWWDKGTKKISESSSTLQNVTLDWTVLQKRTLT